MAELLGGGGMPADVQVDLRTLQEDVEDANDKPGKVHLLLRNGFSRACRADRSSYGALFDEADFTGASGNVEILAPGAFGHATIKYPETDWHLEEIFGVDIDDDGQMGEPE